MFTSRSGNRKAESIVHLEVHPVAFGVSCNLNVNLLGRLSTERGKGDLEN